MEDDFEFPTSAANNVEEDEFNIPEDDGDAAAAVARMMKVGDEKEIGKNGLKKMLVKEGKGWETPATGDEVEVHYIGTLLDGTKFDSSRERGTPFKFKLGQVLFPIHAILPCVFFSSCELALPSCFRGEKPSHHH